MPDRCRDRNACCLDTSLYDVDRASRAGLKYASTLLLLAELLNHSFMQAHTAGISRSDNGPVIALLGPVACSVFDQFARVSIKATTTSHDQALDLLDWSSHTAVEAFRDLPILGNDLFGGQFDTKLREEAERLKALREADKHMSRLRNPSSSQSCQQGSGHNQRAGQGRYCQGKGSQQRCQLMYVMFEIVLSL